MDIIMTDQQTILTNDCYGCGHDSINRVNWRVMLDINSSGKSYEDTKPHILYKKKDLLIFEKLYWKFELIF